MRNTSTRILRRTAVLKAVVLKAVVLSAVLGLLLGACARPDTPEVTNGDPDLEAGRTTFINSCASCHGFAGGGGRGPKLSDGKVLENYPDIADQITIVADGKSSMPSFSGRLDAEQIEAVVRYTREVLTVAGTD